MKKFLKKVIPAILYLPSKKSIVFESNPEFTCNALPVYEEMVNIINGKEVDFAEFRFPQQ